MPKISVITPTVRSEGLELVAKALRRQTFRDFEWIISTPHKKTSTEYIPFIPVWPSLDIKQLEDPEKQAGDYWAVYKAYNNAVKHAQGDLIVSWQDFTFADPHALEKFWNHYEADPKKIVSGVGNKYQDDSWTVVTWKDPRERSDQGSFYPCYYNDIEWNFCAIPKAAMYAVGGFDEHLDKYSSLCGLDVLDRLNMLGGWEYFLDQTNKSYSLEHGRLPKWEENLPFGGPYDERRKVYLENPVLNYLQ